MTDYPDVLSTNIHMDILQRVCLDMPDGIKNPGLVGMDIFMARQKKNQFKKGENKKGNGKRK